MSALSQVTDKTIDKEVINSHMPAVVEFLAEWCKPGKRVTPVIEELALKYQGKIKIAQMNVAENHETPVRFGIRSIPTIILFKGGEVKKIIVGSYPKFIIDEELKKLL